MRMKFLRMKNLKRVYLTLVIIVNVACLSGCAELVFLVKDLFSENIPKGYIDKEEYLEDGFQDYTDYCKYIYNSDEKFKSNKHYTHVNDKSIKKFKEYIEDFKSSMESQERLNEFDFDEKCISKNDYIRIVTKEGEKIGEGVYGKFDSYTVYYFDFETLTLYYMHNNI